MAIKIYQSKVNAAQLRGGTKAATQGAPLRVEEDPLLKAALGATKQVAGALYKKAKEDEEIQQASDLLDESNSYYEETRQFEEEYRLKNKGAGARDAAKAYDEWHRKQYNSRAVRFQGDARQAYMWKKQASQIAMGSTGRGMVYAEQQDQLYRKEVTAQKTALYYQRVAEAPSDKVINNLRAQYNAEIAAINSPEATEVLMAKADQETAVTRINTAIAEDNAQEAQRLLSEYREAGVLGTSTDEMVTKVETARVNVEAYQASLDIRRLLPEGTKTEKLDMLREMVGDDAEVYKSARYQVLQDHSGQIALQKEQDTLITDMYQAKIAAATTPELRKQIETQIMSTPMREPIRTKLLALNAKGLKQPLTSDAKVLRELEQRVAVEAITQEELDRDYKWRLSKPDYEIQVNRLKETGGNRVNAYNLEMEDRLSRAFAGEGKQKKTKRFKDFMNQFVKEYQTQHGRMPGNKELKEQETWLLGEVVYDEDIWFHETTERFMLDTLDPSKFDVPDKEKAAITKQFKEAGIEPTKAQVTEVYRKYLLDRK
ncbi:MAG: hypothetical protein GY753_12000 [Gammaproteobacteria bacterium]|nr:hypothetical protein [Gammaproteobacteria bacterium]